MNVTYAPVTVRELKEGYQDFGDAGVVALQGRLDARPPYQREFVYSEAQQVEVIDTVLMGAPLGLVFWAVREPSPENPAEFEILDGQQRTLSLMRFVNNGFSVKYGGVELAFGNLPQDVQDRLLDYELLVYVCDGDESERLMWFRRINIAGSVLNAQELLNAVFSGPWLTHAKAYFSKQGGAAAGVSDGYVKAVANRQEFLVTALRWIARREGTSIEGYMGAHQHDGNANELRNYFARAIDWAKSTFPVRRKELRGVDWGSLYDRFGTDVSLDADELETRVQELMSDPDVTKKSGIYEYVLSGSERALSVRAFNDRDKRTAFEKQGGKCAICAEVFDFEDMQGDHIVAWSQGGRTLPENCQMLCRKCNATKSDA